MINKAINEFSFLRIQRIRQPTQPHSLIAKNNDELIHKKQ